MGCWFGGCTDLGELYKDIGSSIGDSVMNVQGEFEKGESWRYYKLTVDTYANNLVVYSENIIGDVCLGISSFGKPDECNLGTEFTTGNLVCKHPSSVVIGVYSEYLDDNADNRKFSFDVLIDNPYNSMAGLGCSFGLLMYTMILLVLILIWVGPLICCTVYFVLLQFKSKRGEYDEFTAEPFTDYD
eukprot:CAMPEP_0206199804 /NCGR_PEP_ID=MMETSP0166-20121206/10486_1 /ASSEMBLY_ACC=CAM_ASM_000260 /TAXON_ID=95228 /ORGANISM="Vannella robusta, Strain DIVA3 518/3/11/1/6" /LENGTH=185 /DNA_ID=CAMNT_0053617989 /DNA_START=99 /DNA_END=656 /DNA_ORIENTATION=+